MRTINKNLSRKRRIKRVRSKVFGTAVRPRLCVFRSLKYIYAQIVDDTAKKTLAFFDSRKLKNAKNNIETAKKVGEEIARLAKGKKIEKVFFDKHGYKYHGKVKALAEGAREGGLKF